MLASSSTAARSPETNGAPQRGTVVALVGNPNTSKTTLFNALTGYRRHVANYLGVTVDVGRGSLRGASSPIEILDLPETYSLAAMSPDEMVVANVLNGRFEDRRRPDCILAIVDASNLQRNLYLLSQLLEVGLPVVVALNMVDIARSRGFGIDHESLSDRLGRKPVYLMGAAFCGLFAFPFFWLVETGDSLAIGTAIVLAMAVGHAAMYGPQAAFLSEMFGTRVRYTGASLGYQLASPFAGGLAPLIATALLAWAGGDSWPVAIYLAAVSLLTLVSVFLASETYRSDLSSGK